MDDVDLPSELFICAIELFLFSGIVKCSWPSGPRRQIKALVSQEAWVQTPPNTIFGFEMSKLSVFFISSPCFCASVKVPVDSMPTTQSPKREVGTIALWPQARA